MGKLLLRYFPLIILILTLSNKCFSQFDSSQNIFYIKELPTEGVLLDKGWKFHSSDNPEYAKPGYDDSKWQSIDPSLAIYDQQTIATSGICWLRLHIIIDSNLMREQLAIITNQVTASEIYLNGALICRFGTVSMDSKAISAYDPWGKYFSFPFNKSTEQVLAVRYAVEPNLHPTILRDNPLLEITINEINATLANKQWRERGLRSSITFRIGAFFILAFFYFAFFCYYPKRKANLFFCLYAVFLILGDAFQLNMTHEVKYSFLWANFQLAFWQLASLFLLTALYLLLGQKRGWIYWVLIVSIITGIFLYVLRVPHSFEICEFWIKNIVNIEIVRTASKALKLKTRGAWIITAGAISFLIFWGALVLGYYYSIEYVSIRISENFKLDDVLYNLAYLSIPMATAIYLALDFAFTSHALQQKLAEVEKLSEKTIAQEKEKQEILAGQKDRLEIEVKERTAELSKSLTDLKSTQTQLIQSEKMASLGELTAGIAHEIQNPLNFVNNFSEVNKEMIDEVSEEIDKGNYDEVKIILNDIKDNEEKINHHGKRADAIVKGMLQHSRVSTGTKEPTDINALADEYLRLSYHGMRAKDKSFNAEIKTDFDNSIEKINVVPQDIGRVLLNLFNNAFYALQQKQNLTGLQNLSGLNKYEPMISVCTKRISSPSADGGIEIHVKDNGTGIPQKVVDKIFQPFFTTKPAGQGTGLGLSLSYDIIKAHSGEIKVETKEGEGSEFIIQLPFV